MSEGSPIYQREALIELQKRTKAFKRKTGRRPRILLSGKDETQMKALAIVYSDAGFDVDISPVCVTPELVARMAVDNDVHVVGLVGSGSGQRFPKEDLIRKLEAIGAGDIKLVADNGQLLEHKNNQNQDFKIPASQFVSQALTLING
ncbi:MAG: hypothetical protein KKF12_06070 [Proteobacteria bacterium]|nr:hypothetical protein [Pseudomonadota bacterium]MBU4130364.1 hypothetical protein [Pseudomonadota bacterium]